uniref:DUF834 domain-containing protein n=1 Tax=Oryza sativa subsp. japonica TaxID=39947 RepID=Q6Z7A9_ORYSJ|nr:hypothetical protein [Oryza sativa Japonica Group]BAD07939.1 hypothetical protein [Oryza sativa Japonica Group]
MANGDGKPREDDGNRRTSFGRLNSPEREGMRIPVTKLDEEGAAGVELSLANPTTATARCGGDPSGG